MDDSHLGPVAWSAYPSGITRETRDEVEDATRVVAMAAWIVATPSATSTHFLVFETADLADGRRVFLAQDRGWTESIILGDVPLEEASRVSEDLHRTAAQVIGPDEGEASDQQWVRLAHAAEARGLAVRPDELKSLPYSFHVRESRPSAV